MLTSPEQYFLEMLNRARLNPGGEAERFGFELNDPDPANPGSAPPADTLSTDARQPLVGNAALSSAATSHSQAFLDGEVVREGQGAGHQWKDGTTQADRAEAAGFGSRFVGENFGWMATVSALSPERAMLDGVFGKSHHQALFESVSHRVNMLDNRYIEAGVGQVEGLLPAFLNDTPFDLNASVLTNKLGWVSQSDRFLLGVAYDDADGDGFYSMGEGRAGITVTVLGRGSTVTEAAGGYGLALGTNTAPVEVVIDWHGTELRAGLAPGGGNLKLDVLDGQRLLASGDLTLGDGVTEGGLLGIADLALTGNASDNLLLVGNGNNTIDGVGGVNTVVLTGVRTDYDISFNDDVMTVADMRGGFLTDGVNTLTNIDLLRFGDDALISVETLLQPVITLGVTLTDLSGAALDNGVVTFAAQQDGGQGIVAQGVTTGGGPAELALVSGMTGRVEATRDWQDGDPAVTALDALDVLRMAVGLTPSFGPAAPQNYLAADLNGDGVVTALDALEVLRAAVGIESANAPRWVFVDSDMDWDAQELSRSNAALDHGMQIDQLSADMNVEMTGILLGHMTDVT